MTRIAVAAGSQLAADGGASVARQGGNAVDAAVAAAMVSMCTDPTVMALGSGGFITIWPLDNEPVVIDAYAEIPGRGVDSRRLLDATRRVSFDYGGPTDTLIGYGSISTPGILAGFDRASSGYGSAPWPALIEPAIEAVTDGFPLRGAAAEFLGYTYEAIYEWHPESAAVLAPEGRVLTEGEIVEIPGLAATLTEIAELGVRALYGGSIGERIVHEVLTNGGLVTMDDLMSYEPVIRRPVVVERCGWQVATNPPPAIGGSAMAAMLLLGPDGEGDWSSETTAQMVEAQWAVVTFRRNHLDVSGMAPREAVRLLELVQLGDRIRLLESPSTIHTSAVDDSGLGCAVTASAGYGSGVLVPGTGIWLNNSLGEIELHPGGLGDAEPGTRLTSNMAPTVARRTDRTTVALGSPGASRITSATSQVLHNLVDHSMGVEAAVAHPRLNAESFEGRPTVAHEPGLPMDDIEDFDLRPFDDLHMYFGGVHTAAWTPELGCLAVGDPRRAGGSAIGSLDSQV